VKRPVRVLRRAARDLQTLHDYLAREAPRRAGPFLDRLLAAIESLEEHAERGPQPRDEALRQRGYRFLAYRDYLVFYKVMPRQVRVYRVLHAKRAYRPLL
jgi:toxin ParE1/3/4